MTRSSLIALKTSLLLLLCITLLTACGSVQQAPTLTLPADLPATPTLIASQTRTPTRTSTPKQTYIPTQTQIPTRTRIPTQTPEPGAKPTSTISPELLPQGSADEYRLKAWDISTALQIYTKAGKDRIALEYDEIREFYQLSLLEELYLSFPELRTDPELLRDQAYLKGRKDTYWPYGLLHDYSVEPFRLGLEQALNDGSAKLPQLQLWGETIFDGNSFSAVQTSRLFGDNSSSTVLQISQLTGWDFFVLHENADGSYNVIALYPEWQMRRHNDATFEVTDLNGNGRDEIAVTMDVRGSGMSYYCETNFFLYEWDGEAFRDLMISPLHVSLSSLLVSCGGVSFKPDTNGRMLIQTGVWMFTDCENYYYREIITYRWNGSGFVQLASAPPTPPDSRKPDKCAIEWAFAAGSDNVSAVNLLAAAVADWPSEAEEVWGPAAHDYFKLKLASWYLSLGQVQRGIELFEQVRDAPSEPKFQFTSQVATTFLETAEAKGIYQATLAVDSLFEKTWKSMCETLGCTRDKILEQCGFAELEWGIEYGGFAMSELYSFDAISLELNQNPPTSMGDLRIQLQNMGLTPIWIGEADVDGLGQPDWLVDLRSSQMLFLRQNGRLIRIELPIYFLKSKPENRTHIWEIYELGSHAPGINIYQIGNDLFAFHLSKENGMYEVVFDVDSTYLATPAEPEHFEMQEWSVQDGNLIVQYDGGKGIYVWDHEGKGVDPWKGFNGSLVPTGYSPELFEENISRAEQALYLEDNPVQAIEILTKLLEDHILENYTWSGSAAPRLRPYAQYLLGLAYERRGDSENAVRLYWQLWHDYPTNPFALAAQSKLEFK